MADGIAPLSKYYTMKSYLTEGNMNTLMVDKVNGADYEYLIKYT